MSKIRQNYDEEFKKNAVKPAKQSSHILKVFTIRVAYKNAQWNG